HRRGRDGAERSRWRHPARHRDRSGRGRDRRGCAGPATGSLPADLRRSGRGVPRGSGCAHCGGMNVHDHGHDAAFTMNTAISAALATLDANTLDLTPGPGRDGAYHYARGQRYEPLSNTPAGAEPCAPCLGSGLVSFVLESRSIPYRPEDYLAVTQVVGLEGSSIWSPPSLNDASVRGLSEKAQTGNLTLVCAGLLSGIDDPIAIEP